MQLKLLLALVIEKLYYRARFFPLWVYRLELQSLGAWQEMTDSGAQAMADKILKGISKAVYSILKPNGMDFFVHAPVPF